jgi:hypothetical protein
VTVAFDAAHEQVVVRGKHEAPPAAVTAALADRGAAPGRQAPARSVADPRVTYTVA